MIVTISCRSATLRVHAVSNPCLPTSTLLDGIANVGVTPIAAADTTVLGRVSSEHENQSENIPNSKQANGHY